MKIVWTVFEKFEIFIERLGEKRYDCIGGRKNFPTPKKNDTLLAEYSGRPTDVDNRVLEETHVFGSSCRTAETVA